jgi:hypothetical protein
MLKLATALLFGVNGKMPRSPLRALRAPSSSISSPIWRAHANAPSEEEAGEAGEVIMLGDYPFYARQPTARMDAVFDRNAARARTSLGEDNVVDVRRVGSSAIPGMPGTPVVDMLAICRRWPPDAAALTALAAEPAGFVAQGLASHAEDDLWFFGGDGPPGTLGRSVLHVVAEDNPWARDAVAFVECVTGARGVPQSSFSLTCDAPTPRRKRPSLLNACRFRERA